MLEQLEKELKNVAESVKDDAPWILAGATVIGFGVSLILAAKAGRKHERIIEDLDRDDISTEEYNKKLKKETAKCYIPPAISAAITVLCMVGSAKLGYSQMVAMIACCTTLKQQYTEYRKANIELNGEEADKKVVTELEYQRASDSQVCIYSDTNSALLPDNEEILFWNEYTGYFTANKARIMEAEYHLNRNIQLRGDALVTEFIEFLGIDTKKEVPDNLGWCYSSIAEQGYFWLDIEHTLVKTTDGLECYNFDFYVSPEVIET